MPPRDRLPETTEELRERLGIVPGARLSLSEVEAARDQLCTWIVEAARTRWPDAWERLGTWPSDVRFRVVWGTALERWPGLEEVSDSIAQAERTILRAMGPLA